HALFLLGPCGYRSAGDVVECLVRAPMIVETEVATQRRIQVGPTGEAAGIDQFVLSSCATAAR
ncbi:MAG: hypothetical protein WB566_19295, partial [Terriglobales bacterium]